LQGDGRRKASLRRLLLQKRWDHEFVFIVGSFSIGKERRQDGEMRI